MCSDLGCEIVIFNKPNLNSLISGALSALCRYKRKEESSDGTAIPVWGFVSFAHMDFLSLFAHWHYIIRKNLFSICLSEKNYPYPASSNYSIVRSGSKKYFLATIAAAPI